AVDNGSTPETFSPPTLQTGTRYYWRIVSKTMANMTSTGPTWSFTTAGAAGPPPTVTSITPNTGSTAGGTPVTIGGTNFVSGASVNIGGVAASGVSVTNSTTITAVTPAHSAGTVSVIVTNPDGQGATLANAFTYTTPPPPPPPTGNDVVLYASEAPVRIGNWTVVADSSAAGGARIFNPDAGLPKLADALPNPSTYFEMTFQAEAGTGYRLWIRGKAQADSWANDSVFAQFSDSLDANGGTPVFRIGTVSGSVINLEDCSGCGLQNWGWQDNGWGVGVMGPLIYFAGAGTHTIRIQYREDGLSIDQIVLSPATYLNVAPGTLKNDTTILPRSGGGGSGPPTITSISPTSGSTAGGTSVTITGTNFVTGATVTLGGSPATNVNVTNSTSMTAVAPAHAAGTVSVTVTNPDAQSGTLTNGFTYSTPPPPPAPTVIGVSPNSGSTSGGTAVTISGTNFVAGATVTFGGAAASNIVVSSSSSISATTPPHAAGSVSVVVSNPDGQSGTLANGFSYSVTPPPPPAPTVSGISPSSGPISGGTQITISGANFVTGATVSLGGAAASNVTVTSATSISAVTPAHAAGVVNVTVTNPDAQSGTLSNAFTYSAGEIVLLADDFN
ncbi:MAG: IPT/TIG domain-containing protein, partial [Blastocatellia bacterium]